MEISCQKEGILVKGQGGEILFDHPPTINQLELSGAGEYEIGGVFAQGYSESLFLFKLEDLKLVYFRFNVEDLNKNYLERLSEIDILILDGRSDKLDVSKIVSEINRLEPKLVVPFHFPNIQELVKAGGVTKLETEKLKVKKGELTEEERKLLVLPCSLKSS